MTRIRVDGKPKRGAALYGYAKWLLAEYNPSDGKRGFTTYCIYEVPDDVAREMIAKGARKVIRQVPWTTSVIDELEE